MANHVSSLKRARQTETKTAINRSNKSKLRGTLRALREAIGKGDAKAAMEQFRATASVLDKSVQKGVLHKNTASRYKSRLNARRQGHRGREGRLDPFHRDSSRLSAHHNCPSTSAAGSGPAHPLMPASHPARRASAASGEPHPLMAGHLPR